MPSLTAFWHYYYRGLRSLEFHNIFPLQYVWANILAFSINILRRTSYTLEFYHFSSQDPVSERLGPVPADLQAWAKRASVVTTVSRKREARWDLFCQHRTETKFFQEKSRSRSPIVRKRSASRGKETKIRTDSRRRGKSPAKRDKRSPSSRAKRSPSPTKTKKSRRERTRKTDSD